MYFGAPTSLPSAGTDATHQQKRDNLFYEKDILKRYQRARLMEHLLLC
jgi:hypothetical protein